MDIDVLTNRRFQFPDASESAPPNPFISKFGEPSLHQVQPRAVRGREMNMESRALGQPLSYDRRFVGAVVVEDKMNEHPGRPVPGPQ